MQTAITPLPHSGLGLASLAVSIVAGLGMLALLVIASVAQARPGGLDENSPGAIAIGLALVLLGMWQLLALGLGIAGLMQPGRSKTFGVLGVVFSSACLLGSCLLMLIGALME